MLACNSIFFYILSFDVIFRNAWTCSWNKITSHVFIISYERQTLNDSNLETCRPIKGKLNWKKNNYFRYNQWQPTVKQYIRINSTIFFKKGWGTQSSNITRASYKITNFKVLEVTAS